MFARRSATLFALALAILPCAAATAVAQIDNEATNGLIGSPDDLGITVPNSAILNQATLFGVGDDVDFFSANLNTGDVLLGMTTHLASLPGSFDSPNTMASVFDALFLTPSTFNDDDGGDELPAGASRGSLFRFIAPMGGAYPIGVTGSADVEFDGANTGAGHAETGSYLITAGHVSVGLPGGDFVDVDPLNDVQPGAGLIALNASGAAVSVGELAQSGDDVDFFRLNGLTAGQVLSAMTAPLEEAIPFNGNLSSPNTVLGLFDSNGLLLVNDDAGMFNEFANGLGSDSPFAVATDTITGSALRALIPNDGDYFLAVSGFDDFDFEGTAHGEVGTYALLVSVFGEPDGGGGNGGVPEPGTMWLTLLGLVGLWHAARRRRVRA